VTAAQHLATAEDLLTLPEGVRAEILHGEIVRKADPSMEHGEAQGAALTFLRHSFHGGGGGGPGGWWLVPEVDVELERHEVIRPDIAGWRRDRHGERPRGRPIRERPDFVCEVLSASNAKTDLVTKLRLLQRHHIPHYWIIDPDRETLVVYRYTQEGYLVALTASAGESVRAEPFDAIELRVGTLFGED
jgi:Uma2 family endonuclease